MAHKPSCAARIRATAEVENWALEATVASIAECCSVSRLRAHRLARAWTLRRAVDEMRQLCAQNETSQPSVDQDQLAAWEKGRMPRGKTLDLLCRLYETDAQGLGLAGSYRPGVPTSILVPARPAPSRPPAGTPVPLASADPASEAI
ncbi:hypothetical protein ACFVT9_28550 [Kitasatospora cineracea]|uniref:hypothetical protein n=1 Tax=Kitasatospora cineracea TaxID=88074 RepID=UPI0036DF876C